MNLTLPQLVVGAVGALLIYAAVKNESPVTIVKNAINGQPTATNPASTTRYGSADSQERNAPAATGPTENGTGGPNIAYLKAEGTKTPLTKSGIWVDPKSGKLMSV